MHRLETGRRLILGGVQIPYEKGLLGHSDADVVLHALMNAFLGALGEGDIGTHFPDSDPKYKGISSEILTGRVVAMMRGSAFEIVNADITIIAQEPRLAPHFGAMRERIAQTSNVSRDSINLKAGTMEGLGPLGKGEGMAAMAVVLLQKTATVSR